MKQTYTPNDSNILSVKSNIDEKSKIIEELQKKIYAIEKGELLSNSISNNWDIIKTVNDGKNLIKVYFYFILKIICLK